MPTPRIRVVPQRARIVRVVPQRVTRASPRAVPAPDVIMQRLAEEYSKGASEYAIAQQLRARARLAFRLLTGSLLRLRGHKKDREH